MNGYCRLGMMRLSTHLSSPVSSKKGKIPLCVSGAGVGDGDMVGVVGDGSKKEVSKR